MDSEIIDKAHIEGNYIILDEKTKISIKQIQDDYKEQICNLMKIISVINRTFRNSTSEYSRHCHFPYNYYIKPNDRVVRWGNDEMKINNGEDDGFATF